MKREYHEQLRKEFDRQVENLLQKGYPDIIGVSVEKFTQDLGPLKARLAAGSFAEINVEAGKLPFVIVIKSELVATEIAIQQVEREGRNGFVSMYPVEPTSFKPIDGIKLPGSKAYLLLDIDRGNRTLNVTPDAALKMIEQENRSPLTIDEGIAVITHYPEFLRKNYCFSMLASRCGDRRVPALWISEGRPKLGWCWAGNPHTWLGSASCAGRA